MKQKQQQAPNPAVIQQQQHEAYTQPILKIIINRRQFDLPADTSNGSAGGEKLKNIKLVFIGQVPDATNRTLRKLELGQPLAKQEETELNNQFPYFKTKVGTVDPDKYHVHFINQTIPNNTNTAQLELLVLDLLYGLGYMTTLKQVKQGLVMYGFPRVLPYSYIYDVLEYLYQDTTVLLTGEQICRQLVNKLIVPVTLDTSSNTKKNNHQGKQVQEDGFISKQVADKLLKELSKVTKIAYSPNEREIVNKIIKLLTDRKTNTPAGYDELRAELAKLSDKAYSPNLQQIIIAGGLQIPQPSTASATAGRSQGPTQNKIMLTVTVNDLLRELKLTATVAYSPLELSNNADFQKLIRQIPLVFAPRRYKKTTFENLYVSNDIYTFEGYQLFTDCVGVGLGAQQAQILASVKYSAPDLSEYTLIDNSALDDIINFAGLTTNNTLMVYLGTDIYTWYESLPQSTGRSNNFQGFVQTFHQRTQKFATLDDFTTAVINNRRNFRVANTTQGVWTQATLDALGTNPKWVELSNTVRNGLCNSPALEILGIKCQNFIFDCYDMGIETHINLKSLFQDIETNYYLPLVKYVSDRETQLYNIYKPFFRNLDERLLNIFLRGKDRIMLFNEEILATSGKPNIRRLKQLINWDYIVFKWRVDDDNLVNIYLFPNGYIITEYQTAQTTDAGAFIEQTRVLGYMKLLTKIISKIKDKYKLSELSLPNPERILKTTTGLIEYSHLLNVGFKYEFEFANRLLWAWTKLHGSGLIANKYDKIDDWIRAKGQYAAYDGVIGAGFIKKLNTALANQPNMFVQHKYEEEIRFIYTSAFGFYSRDNAKYFMRTHLKDRGDRVGTAEKEKMFTLVSRIFKITIDECQSVFEDIQSIELQTKYSFLYPVVECRLKLSPATHKLILTIDNISQYNLSPVILAQLDTLIKDVVLGSSQSVNLDMLLKDVGAIRELTCANAIEAHKQHQAKVTKSNTAPNKISKAKIGDIDSINVLDTMDINLDDINFGGLDMGIDMGGLEIDLDMDAIEKLILIESEDARKTGNAGLEQKEKDGGLKKNGSAGEKLGAQEEGLQDIKLKQFVGNRGKLTVVAYMQEMRKLFDPDLYEPVVKGKPSDYNYEHHNCPDTPKRQPFIVSKDKLKTIDPESITGYMRYNNNYYICPRIWDAKVDRPISVRQFIENGLKSPYTGGLPIIQSPRKNEISDKYSVIIRKPTTQTYWSDPNLHPEWPEILKKTEREAYPGLVHGNKHPNKVCVPCCFKHRPDDLDTTKTELQQFLKVSGSATCQYHGEPESYPGAGDNPNAIMDKLAKADKPVETFCKNEEYLSSAGTQLKNCRLGLLPEELNILLNNSQELFLKQNDAAIDNNANFFLRRGINENHVTNILDTFSAIFELKLERLLNIIYNKLTPMDFIELNNGELVDIFCGAGEYPIDAKDREKFIKFLGIYPDLLEYLNADIRDILTNLENRDINLVGEHQPVGPALATGAKHLIMINIRLLYRIYSAYYNYLAYLVSPNEIKNYRYVIQIFSRPRKWLIKQGVNILIFDKNSSQIKCLDNFNYKTDRLIILIEEAPNYFIPVFHVQSKYNQLQKPVGIIKLDDTLNLTDTAAAVILKKRPTQQKLIDATKDRLSSIIRLLYVQAGLCNYNMSYYHAKLVKTIRTTRIGLITQYLGLGDSTQTQYLRIGSSERNSVFIPIYPHFMERRVTVSDFYSLANDMHAQRFNLSKLADNLYPSGNIGGKVAADKQEPYELMMLLDLGYHISEIIIERESGNKDKPVIATGVRFANDLELPLLPQEFKPKEISSIIARIGGKRADGHTATITTKPIINLLKLLSAPTALSQASFNIHALLNLLLHQTKNNLSYYISGQQHLKDTSSTGQAIKSLIAQIYNTNETARDENLFYGCLDDVLQQIIKVDKQTLTEYIRNYFTDRRTGKSRLIDKSYTRKVVDLVCKKTTKAGKQPVGQGDTAQQQQGAIAALCVREVLGSQSKTRIRMPAEIYEYILMAIGKDLINNKIEADSIVKGRYIIPSDDLISSRVSNTIYNTTQDFQQNLIISPAEMSYYVAHNLISKYRRNFKLANPTAAIELGKETTLANKDLDVLANIVIKDVKNRLVSGLSSIFSSISSSSTSSDVAQTIQIKTTVFNSEGILNPAARHAPCVFPYKATGKLNYHCGPAKDVLNGNKRRLDQQGLKDNDLICPTEINNDKNVVNWGYCPSTPIAAQTRLGSSGQVTDAYQYANRNLLKKVGNCDFPFIYANRKIVNPLSRAKPFVSVSYKCAAQGDSAPIQNGTWCYVGKNAGIAQEKTPDKESGKQSDKQSQSIRDSKTGNDINDIMDDELTAAQKAKSPSAQVILLIGAAKGDTIYKGDWSLGDLVNKETGAPEVREFAAKWERATGKNPAICEIAQDDTKREKIEKALGLEGVERITRETYNPDFCTAGASKKGYEKQQLYLFGRDELGINYKSMLNENNKILKKDELCELINNKLRDIKKADILAAAGTLDPEKLKELRQGIYTKDPALCMKGPTKGGYKLTELRDMAITYFGLSQAEADKIDKKQGFCDHITKALGLAIKFNVAEGSNTGSKSGDNGINMSDGEIYPADRNIELCARPTSRGGLSSKDLKHIAGTKLGIDISGKSKEELCQIIKQKMIEIANAPPADTDERQNSVTAELRAARVEDALKSEKETGSIGELPIAEVDKLNL